MDLNTTDTSTTTHRALPNIYSDDDPNGPQHLWRLSMLIMLRFKQTGHIEDLDQAVSAAQQSVDLTPDSHADLVDRLNALSAALGERYKRLGRLNDIEKKISIEKRAVKLTQTSDAEYRSIPMAHLAVSLMHRFESLGEVQDIEEAISIQRQVLDLTPDSRLDKSSRLMTLGNLLLSRFKRSGEIRDIDEAIRVQQQALDLTPDGHPDKPSFLCDHGASCSIRFRISHENNDILSAISDFEKASCSLSGWPSIQFRAARSWAQLCAQQPREVTSTLRAYAIMVSFIPRLAWLGNSVRQRFHEIQSISAAVTEAAAFACGCGQLELALEWLEQGRSIVWGQVLHLRTPMDNLALDHPELHQRLQDVARQLGLSTTSPQLQTNAIDLRSREPLLFEGASRNHRELTERWQDLLMQVRTCPGYQDFLEPIKYPTFLPTSRHGTIVVVNIADERSDALIIHQDSSSIDHIDLPAASKQRVLAMNHIFSQIVSGKSVREFKFGEINRDLYDGSSIPFDALNTHDRDILLPSLSRLDNRYSVPASEYTNLPLNMGHTLGMLWQDVVKPVLDFLGLRVSTPGDKLPRITWCATGPLALLPLHAAGNYIDQDSSQDRLYNYAVSSYTPTLTALQNAAQERSDDLQFRGLLAISQPATPGLPSLTGTTREVEKIKGLMAQHRFDWLDDRQATVGSVLNNMDQYSWIHFACHGMQRHDEAIQSAFALYDGYLTLEKIGQKSLKSAKFAFLSACQTATGTSDLSDEAVHLGAGMLTAGYQSVIATLWSISDYLAPRIAEDVYRELLKDKETKNGQAAYALHKAVERLRKEVGENNFISWVPFIHLGL